MRGHALTDDILPSDRPRTALLAPEDASDDFFDVAGSIVQPGDADGSEGPVMPDQNIPDAMVPEAEIRWTLSPPPRRQPAPSTPDWPAIHDHRDLVIHELADSEALLRERVASLEEDNNVQREILSESMALNVRLTAQLEAARRQVTFLQRRGPTT